MAGFIAVPHCVKVEIKQLLDTIPVVNVLHMAFAGPGGSSSDLNTVATGVYESWDASLLAQQNVDLTLEEVIVTDLTSIASPQGSHTASEAGEDTGDVLSANAALCVSLHESIRYRGGHGRLYIGGISQDRLETPRTWSASTITDFSTAADAFRSYINAISQGDYGLFTWVILHARMATVHPVPPDPVYEPPFFYAVTGTAVDGRVDSQRRRLGH